MHATACTPPHHTHRNDKCFKDDFKLYLPVGLWCCHHRGRLTWWVNETVKSAQSHFCQAHSWTPRPSQAEAAVVTQLCIVSSPGTPRGKSLGVRAICFLFPPQGPGKFCVWGCPHLHGPGIDLPGVMKDWRKDWHTDTSTEKLVSVDYAPSNRGYQLQPGTLVHLFHTAELRRQI